MMKLRRLRYRHGLGLNSVAKAVGIAPSCLSRLERGLSRNVRHAELLVRFYRGEITETEILYPTRRSETHAALQNAKHTPAA